MKNNLFELKVWQKSIDLCAEIYTVTGSFPDREKYGLTSQIRRCTVSIASNIAEGAGRNTKGEFRQFLGIAKGSGYELLTQIIISHKLNFIEDETKQKLVSEVDEIHKMIYGLQQKLT
jgi:four helix bundle protein